MKLEEAKQVLKSNGYLVERNMKNNYEFDVCIELEDGDEENDYYMFYVTNVGCDISPAEPDVGINFADYNYYYEKDPIIVYVSSAPVTDKTIDYKEIFDSCNGKLVDLPNIDFDKAEEFTKSELGQKLQKMAIKDLDKKCDSDYFDDELQSEIDRCYPEPPDADPWED